jgi:hypothetical protein
VARRGTRGELARSTRRARLLIGPLLSALLGGCLPREEPVRTPAENTPPERPAQARLEPDETRRQADLSAEETAQPEPERSGTAELSARVKDSISGDAIEGAPVEIRCPCLAGPRRANTDERGVVSFADLPHGEYSISVSYGVATRSLWGIVLPRGAKFRAVLPIDPTDPTPHRVQLTAPRLPPGATICKTRIEEEPQNTSSNGDDTTPSVRGSSRGP